MIGLCEQGGSRRSRRTTADDGDCRGRILRRVSIQVPVRLCVEDYVLKTVIFHAADQLA